jgi:PHD/YefM family antitoxin component YafN of YafNO toxin-antitoxin module
MVQYVTDSKGRRKAVMIPIKEWEAMQAKLRKQEILDDLRAGYMEMLEMERKGVKGKTRQELIAELKADTDD